MRKLLTGAISALLLSCGMSQAQSLSIATSGDGTAIYFFGLAISKAAAETTGLDIRPRPFRSSGQGAVFVNDGEVAFGMHNAIILSEAYGGREFYEGRALENIRLVARIAPFRLTFGASGASGIENVADIKGKRFPAGFDATAFGDRLYQAMLATGGLSPDDVTTVQVSDWGALGKAFVRGAIDVNGLVIGSATAKRYAQQVEGYHAVSLGDSDAAKAHLKTALPLSRLVQIEPAEGRDGVTRPVTVLEYDYWMFAHKDAADADVRALLTSLRDGSGILAEVSADLAEFDEALMYQDIGVPFHPAALAFYDEHGLK